MDNYRVSLCACFGSLVLYAENLILPGLTTPKTCASGQAREFREFLLSDWVGHIKFVVPIIFALDDKTVQTVLALVGSATGFSKVLLPPMEIGHLYSVTMSKRQHPLDCFTLAE